MQELMNFLRTDNYLLILSILVVLLFIGFVVLLISNMNLKNKYKKFYDFYVTHNIVLWCIRVKGLEALKKGGIRWKIKKS